MDENDEIIAENRLLAWAMLHGATGPASLDRGRFTEVKTTRGTQLPLPEGAEGYLAEDPDGRVDGVYVAVVTDGNETIVYEPTACEWYPC